ncbi:MAG: methyltransferase domain-containing protein [Nitrospinota bacterium]|nr:methyltransferase domain-containing protein [Nitrospinota bacterium]
MDDHSGAMGADYAQLRQVKRSHKYRLWRRAHEAMRILETFGPKPLSLVADLGCADGAMMRTLSGRFGQTSFIGVELGPELAQIARQAMPQAQIIRGNIAQLPLAPGRFSAAVATAVIEHLPDQQLAFNQIFDILQPGGALVVTVPDPLWERIASMVGHLDDDAHFQIPDLAMLSAMAQNAGFEVVEASKFMLSPVGMPLEFFAERVVRGLGLDALMANQLLAARKP